MAGEGQIASGVVPLVRVSFVTPGLVLPHDSCQMDQDGTMKRAGAN